MRLRDDGVLGWIPVEIEIHDIVEQGIEESEFDEFINGLHQSGLRGCLGLLLPLPPRPQPWPRDPSDVHARQFRVRSVADAIRVDHGARTK